MKQTNLTNSKKTFFKTFCNNNFIDTFLTLIVFAIMIIIISNPKRFASGTISGLQLFFYSVLPGLFPFMFLTKLISELGTVFKFTKKLDKFSYKLFGTPGVSIYAFLMSILSGYPIGAKIIGDLYEKGLINEQQAKKMSVFCTTSGPIFIIGSVGVMMFGSLKIGIIIYLSHIVSSFLLGVLYNFISILSKSKNKNTYQKILKNTQLVNQKFSDNKSYNIITYCLTETINSLFIVGAYITIFFLLTEILESLNIITFLSLGLSKVLNIFSIESEFSLGIIQGLIEVTRGCKTISNINSTFSIVFACGLISFSGFSIIMQSMAFLKQTKIKTHSFIFSKAMHSIISMILCFVFLKIFL